MTKQIQRKATLKQTAIDAEARTVEVAFSSEQPVADWPGVKHILDHGAGVDLARLNDGAPVLMNHDTRSHVGVVDRAWIGEDRIGRALLRFGKGALASEVFQDVQDGVRRHISVGASIDEDSIERVSDGLYRIMRWEPSEISFASVPADHKLGVGRSKRDDAQPEHVTVTDNANDPAATTAVAIERAQREAREDELKRVNSILKIGQEFKCMDFAQEAITTGLAVHEVQRKAGDLYFEAKKKEIEEYESGELDPITRIGMSKGEVKRFSISRAMNAILEGRREDASFEFECSNEIARILDRDPRGIFIPMDVQERAYTRGNIRREMTAGTATEGAELVGTEHQPQNFIEQLRVQVQAIRMGARLLTGLRQSVSIPLKSAGATFAWLAESGTVTLSDHTTGALTLSPKTIGGGTQASRRLMKQSLPAVDDLIMQDLTEGAAETVDLGIIQGSGASNQPTGITQTSGVNTQIVNPNDAPTWAEVVGFETALAADNALKGALAWVVRSPWTGFCKVTEKSSGSGRFIMEAEAGSPFGPYGTLNGYPVGVQNAITTGTAIFGNWNEALVGMWGVLDLRPDPYGAANADAMIIRAFQDIDVGVRHAVSFCVNTLT